MVPKCISENQVDCLTTSKHFHSSHFREKKVHIFTKILVKSLDFEGKTLNFHGKTPNFRGFCINFHKLNLKSRVF